MASGGACPSPVRGLVSRGRDVIVPEAPLHRKGWSRHTHSGSVAVRVSLALAKRCPAVLAKAHATIRDDALAGGHALAPPSEPATRGLRPARDRRSRPAGHSSASRSPRRAG